MDIKILKEKLVNYKLSEQQLEKMKNFSELVIEKNKSMNLTSITDELSFIEKHIIDSISIIDYYDLDEKEILDVGTGAGFPGVILAIVYPNSKFTLLDSNKKKIDFINEAVKKIKLDNVNAICGRAELFNEKSFDVVVSRAVASVSILLEICSNLVKIKGKIILYKGKNYSIEWNKKNESILENKLGFKFEKINEFKINDVYDRVFISYSKISPSRKGFPRLYSQIKTQPIF